MSTITSYTTSSWTMAAWDSAIPATRSWPQRLPCSCNCGIALHADPQHLQSTKGRSQPFLTTSAIKKYLVNDDASPAGNNRGNAHVPGHFKGPPPRTNLDLPSFADMKQRSSAIPSLGRALIRSSTPSNSQGVINIA